MLLYDKKRAKSSIKEGGIDGIYVPRETRIAQKKAFCGAHFSLGDRNNSKCS